MRLAALLAATCLMSLMARADDLTASQILDRAKQASALGLVGGRAEIKLVVDDGHENTKERKLTAASIQLPGETRRLVRFEEPADVRNVAILVIEKDGQAPERLLYLPSQRRVRRVSSRQGGQSFEGTDFSYADLDLAGGHGDQLTREPDADVDGNRCWVISAVPAHPPYGKVVSYVHQKTGVPLQILFEDGSGNVIKRLKATRVKEVDGKWYAFESVMETLARSTKTTLTITSLETKAAQSPDDFTEQALQRQ